MTHKFATLVLAVSALGLSALPAAADSACAASATMNTYLGSGYSCYIGNLDFSNFSYTSSASNPPTPQPATAVTVDTVDNSSGIGFSFNSSWTAVGAGEFSDAAIGFTVTVMGGGAATLEDAAVVQTGGVDSTNTGSIAQVTEDGCSLPGTPCSQEWAVMTSQTSNTTEFATDKIYTPTGSLSVTKDINAQDGTSSNASSTISLVQDTFSQVPEPRSLALLLGLGLVAGLSLKKKLQSVQS